LSKIIWYIVGAVVALVLVASYWYTILRIAALAGVLIVLWHVGSYLIKRNGKKGPGNYCSNCPHPNHGHQACGQCRCTSS
jgi:hypothetical protein